MEIQTFSRQCWNCKAVCLCVCAHPLHVQSVTGTGSEPGCCSSLHAHHIFLQLRVSLSRTKFLTSATSKFQVWLASKFRSRGKGVFNNRTFSSSSHAGPQQPKNAEESGSLRSSHCTKASPHSSSDCPELPLGQHGWGASGGKGSREGNTIP